jgi:hypothetical protein
MDRIAAILNDIHGAPSAGTLTERTEPNGMVWRGHWYKCYSCGTWKDSHVESGASDLQDRHVCHLCYTQIVDGRYVAKQEGPVEAEVPAQYAMASLTDFPSVIRKQLEGWPFKTPLVGLKGKPGRGKSHAICAIARSLAKQGYRVKIHNAIDLKQTWSGLPLEQREAYFKTLISAPHLVIDDITAPTTSPGWSELILRIVDARLNSQGPLLISSMDDGLHLKRKYGSAMLSRIQMFTWIGFLGKDRREQSGKESEEDIPY